MFCLLVPTQGLLEICHMCGCFQLKQLNPLEKKRFMYFVLMILPLQLKQPAKNSVHLRQVKPPWKPPVISHQIHGSCSGHTTH